MYKKFFSFGLMGFIAILLTGLSSGKAFAQYDTITWAGLDRTYLVHLPEGYTGTEPLPLVIAMHGGVGSAFNIENQSGLSEKADEAHFIVVYPEGAPSLLNIRTWNAGNCCGYAMNNDIDDVGFINSLIDHLIGELSIDENRIYATGISNGGMMAYRLACEISERIAAIAPVATTMVVNDCSPTRPMPAIAFHSYLDENIPFQGGVGNGLSDHYNPPQDSVMMIWSQKDACLNIAETVVENDEYTFTRYSDCACLSELHHYITTDGGHSWHGGNGTVIGDEPSEYIDATDVMWDFFTQYTLECNVIDGIENLNGKQGVRVYPNPSNGTCYIETPKNERLINIQLISPNGKSIEVLLDQTELDFTQLPMGMYLLKVTTVEGMYVKRLVYQK